MDFNKIHTTCIGATRNPGIRHSSVRYIKMEGMTEEYVAKIFSLFAPYLQGLSDAKIINMQAKLHALLSKYKASKGDD